MATSWVKGVGWVADEIVVRATDFSVQTFRSTFKSGLAKPTFFTFSIVGGPLATSEQSALVFHTISASIPDLSIQTFQHSYYGVPINRPWENSTNDLELEIICSGDMWERTFFDDWQRKIINYDTLSGSPTFNVSYYNDYVAQGSLEIYDSQQNIKKIYKFQDIWPSDITATAVDWSSTNQIMTFNVTLSYSYWTSV